MRILEASHVVEILREAGPSGLHVGIISKKNGVETNKLGQLYNLVWNANRCRLSYHQIAHILRLLATHHILREVSPDVFALNRISSLVDSGKTFGELMHFQAEDRYDIYDISCFLHCSLIFLPRPEQKYHDSNGIAAFVGLWFDLFCLALLPDNQRPPIFSVQMRYRKHRPI